MRPTLDNRLTPEEMANIKAGRPGVHARAQQAVADSGLVVTSSEAERLQNARKYRPRALYADPRTVSPRWPYAVMRIKRILEGVARCSSIEGAVNGAEYKSLAKEYVELYAFYLMRTRPAPVKGTDHNPFRYLSDEDAYKMFVRKVENICDRSTAMPGLGRWYV